MSALPSESPRPTPALRRPWTAREDALLRAHYDGKDSASIDALCAVLRRSRKGVCERARSLGLSRHVRFTAEDEAFLLDKYHRMSMAGMCERLGRDAATIRSHAARMGLSRKGGVDGFSLRQVAEIMGYGSPHRLRDSFIVPGYLPATKLRWRIGAHPMWVVREAALIRFLRTYPHLYDWRKMADPSGYYRRIAREAWEGAGLLTTREAAARLGLVPEYVATLAATGAIPAIKGARYGGVLWFIRAADVEAYRAARARRDAQPESGWLTVRQASERSGVSTKRLQAVLASGGLAGERRAWGARHRWMVRASDLAAYQAAREQRKAAYQAAREQRKAAYQAAREQRKAAKHGDD